MGNFWKKCYIRFILLTPRPPTKLGTQGDKISWLGPHVPLLGQSLNFPTFYFLMTSLLWMLTGNIWNAFQLNLSLCRYKYCMWRMHTSAQIVYCNLFTSNNNTQMYSQAVLPRHLAFCLTLLHQYSQHANDSKAPPLHSGTIESWVQSHSFTTSACTSHIWAATKLPESEELEERKLKNKKKKTLQMHIWIQMPRIKLDVLPLWISARSVLDNPSGTSAWIIWEERPRFTLQQISQLATKTSNLSFQRTYHQIALRTVLNCSKLSYHGPEWTFNQNNIWNKELTISSSRDLLGFTIIRL